MKLLPDDTAGYRQLLVSVIWLAIHDACTPPTRLPGKGGWYRPTVHASSAILFLFGDRRESMLTRYIETLGMEAEAFQQKLLRTMYAQGGLRHLPYAGLPDNAAKAFRFNHTYWLVNEKGENIDIESFN